jgi:hypothetical protein
MNMEDTKQTAHPLSAEIKTEILQIVEAFDLGPFEGLLTFEPRGGYVLTAFKTRTGIYEHYYRTERDRR